MLKDVIEELFSLADVVLDCLENPLLLLEFLLEVGLTLIVEVQLTDCVLLQRVKFAKGVDFVLVKSGHLGLWERSRLRCLQFGFFDRDFVLGFRVLLMLLAKIIRIKLLDKFFVIPQLLSLLLKTESLQFFPRVELHLTQDSLLTVVDHRLLGIHNFHLLFKAAKLVSKHEVDLILVLLVQIVVISNELALEGHPHSVLINDVPGFLVSLNLVGLSLLNLSALQVSGACFFPQLFSLFLLLLQ